MYIEVLKLSKKVYVINDREMRKGQYSFKNFVNNKSRLCFESWFVTVDIIEQQIVIMI